MPSANAEAMKYISSLLRQVRKTNTKGMLATRVKSADFQPTEAMGEESGESAEHELSESELEELLEHQGGSDEADEERMNSPGMGRGVIGFQRKR